MFLDVVPLKPTRTSKSDSKFINYFIMLVPEGEDIAPERKEIEDRVNGNSSCSQTLSATYSFLPATLDVLTLPAYFANGKRVVFNGKGKLCDIDKLEYYEGVAREAIKRAILHYQCYIYAISAFPERFENKSKYFLKEVEVIILCVKRGWKDLELTSVDDITYRLRHVNGISIIVSSQLYLDCILMAQNVKVYASRTMARSAVKTSSKIGMLDGYKLHPPDKKDKKIMAASQHQEKLHKESIRLIKDDTFIHPTGNENVCFK